MRCACEPVEHRASAAAIRILLSTSQVSKLTLLHTEASW